MGLTDAVGEWFREKSEEYSCGTGSSARSENRGEKVEGLLAEALRGLVGSDFTVANVDHSVGIFCDIRLVCHEDDGITFRLEVIEKGHNLDAGL